MPGYTLADGVTLKNLLGATNHDELERLEASYLADRLLQIELGYGPTGQFDAEHLKAIHHHLFQDVYEWAGHTRDERVALSDGTIATEPNLRKADGQPFLIGPAIPGTLEDIGAKLRDADHLRGLSREVFAERAADIMADLNAAHPFREGNGRTQRVFMEQLAQSAGHDLDFSVVSKERMIQASIAANELGDNSMMRRMFDEISDPARVALLREGIERLQTALNEAAARTGQASQFDWNDRYLATLTPGHTVELVLAGVAGDQFMARTNEQILFGKVSDLPQPAPERGESFTVTPLRQQQQKTQESRVSDSDRPLSANEVSARFGNPSLQARYQAQEQREQENRERTGPASPTAATAADRAAHGNVPTEKQADHKAAQEKTAKAATRDIGDGDRSRDRDRDNERGGRPRGGGGRSRR